MWFTDGLDARKKIRVLVHFFYYEQVTMKHTNAATIDGRTLANTITFDNVIKSRVKIVNLPKIFALQ